MSKQSATPPDTNPDDAPFTIPLDEVLKAIDPKFVAKAVSDLVHIMETIGNLNAPYASQPPQSTGLIATLRVIDYALSLDASTYWNTLIMHADADAVSVEDQTWLALQLINSSVRALAQWNPSAGTLEEKGTLRRRAISAMRAVSYAMRDDAEKEYDLWFARVVKEAEEEIDHSDNAEKG